MNNSVIKSCINLLAMGCFFLSTPPLFAEGTRLSSTSQQGRTLALTFLDTPITTDATKAEFCADEGLTLSEAKLWMPEMGHGSSSTRLKASTTPSCMEISRINFVMAGAWEIRVKMTDGDSATFLVDVTSAP